MGRLKGLGDRSAGTSIRRTRGSFDCDEAGFPDEDRDCAPGPHTAQEQRDWILRATGSAFLEFDSEARVTTACGMFARLSGIAEKELLGRKLTEVLPVSVLPGARVAAEQEVIVSGRRLHVHVEKVQRPTTSCVGRLCLTAVDEPAQPAPARSAADAVQGCLQRLVGSSAQLNHLKDLALRIARSELPALLIGESGTRKELFARAIHEHSARGAAPFVAVNCAALPETLLESQLFGYEGGAFTGADRKGRPGLFEQARGGTLLLDEVGELPMSCQAVLLRVLEERCVRRVGGLHPVPIDVRIIAATNRPLENMVEEGVFRLDLFHRLCVLPMRLNPLRERAEDIPSLIAQVMAEMGDRRSLPADVMDCLLRYPWPGNVRELRHCIEYMCTVSSGRLSVEDLPPAILAAVTGGGGPGVAHAVAGPCPDAGGTSEAPAVEELDDLEKFILEAIAESNAAGQGLGRLALLERARNRGVAATENKIRGRLQALKDLGAVEWHRGRGGARLTARGRSLLAMAAR